jgi:hypothetical protein
MKTEFYRVLKPQEAKSIIEKIPKMKHKMAFKTELYTGMRFKELHLFSMHPEWFRYDRRLIILPAKYTKTSEERKVNLTPQSRKSFTITWRAGTDWIFPYIRLGKRTWSDGRHRRESKMQ